MDYKITNLSEEVKCEMIALPDFPAIKFGNYGRYNLFNLTEYLKSLGNTSDNYRTLSRPLMGWIEKLTSDYGIPVQELFYKNPNGDELVNGVLLYLFLFQLQDGFMRYANDLLDDILVDGFAYSDSYIFTLAKNRLTPDILQKLADEKRNISKQEDHSSL